MLRSTTFQQFCRNWVKYILTILSKLGQVVYRPLKKTRPINAIVKGTNKHGTEQRFGVR